jgi:hypothetical protein
MAVAAAGWVPAALRIKLSDQDIGPNLQEVETRRRPEWKDTGESSPPLKSYWAQWKSLSVRNGILESH